MVKRFQQDKVHFTFHGGEPLLAGYDFYSEALEKLSNIPNFEGFSLQSNIWLLNQNLIDLFKKYNVVISTSIDGQKKSMIIKEEKVTLIKQCPNMN